MLKIGDFSKFSRVSVKALRYYDEIGLLKPVSVDQFTGYRYYSADQLQHLNRIVGLKDLGLSLEEISEVLKEDFSPARLIEILQAKCRETKQRVRQEEARLKRVEEWLKKIEKEGTMPVNDVVIKKVEALTVASVRDVIPTYGDIGKLYNELFSYLGRSRVRVEGPPMAIYHDMEYREKDADVEAAVPVTGKVAAGKKVIIRDLPAEEQMAVVIHKGAYENFSQTYAVLMTWVESHGYQIAGPNREIYIKGPGKILKGNPETYITEIQLPVKKA